MDWKPIETLPDEMREGRIVMLGHDGRGGVLPSICPGYWAHDAWRNWFKGPDYAQVIQGQGRVSTSESVEIVWFDPTHWMHMPAPPGSDAKHLYDFGEEPGIPIYHTTLDTNPTKGLGTMEVPDVKS